MARQKNTKSAPPSKAKADGTDPFAVWRHFYAIESARILDENPNLKHAVVRKRVSALYKKHKAELASRASCGEE
ncbi:hypothetical protein JCM3775_007383 [Rhodotorula graminis]